MNYIREQFASIATENVLAGAAARIAEENADLLKRLSKTGATGDQMRNLAQTVSARMEAARRTESSALSVSRAVDQMYVGLTFRPETVRELLDSSGVLREGQSMLDSVQGYTKDLIDQFAGSGIVAAAAASHADEAQENARRIAEALDAGGSIRRHLERFASINKGWSVPSEIVGISSSLHEIQDLVGKVSLPTIDWSSAAALAEFLGSDGIADELTRLGIDADGSMISDPPETGSAETASLDLYRLLNFLLTMAIFLYAVNSSERQEESADAFQTEMKAEMLEQGRRIEALSNLVEAALARSALESELRYVVRDRLAKVRIEPAHGSTVTGLLLPNEVLRAVDRKDRWVEVEYYHWLHGEYQTGWVLKKYVERVPAGSTE